MPFDNQVSILDKLNARDWKGLYGSLDRNALTPRQRLIALHDLLLVIDQSPSARELWNYARVDVSPECGTAGCAIGWYDYATGYAAVPDQEGGPNVDKGLSKCDAVEYAVGKEFGMSTLDVDRIFMGRAFRTRRLDRVPPHAIAELIDAYIAKNPE